MNRMITRNISLALCASIIALAQITGCSTTKKTQPTPVIEQKKPDPRQVKRYDDPVINGIIFGAWNHYTAGRYEQSALDFERLIVKGYTHYDILFGAGCAYLKYYDLKKSMRYFSECIKTKNNHFEALFFRAVLFRQMKDFAKARADFEAILVLDDNDAFICGLYTNGYANKELLERRKNEAHDALKTL